MNLPNALSVIRILLIPVFAAVFFSGAERAYAYAALVYILASATDILDGHIARKYNKITKLGRILDPLADKLMTATVLLCMCIVWIIPWWTICVYVGKELLMMIGGMLMFGRFADVSPSNKFGKTAAAGVFLALVVILVFGAAMGSEWVLAVISVALALSATAMAVYATNFIRQMRRQNR